MPLSTRDQQQVQQMIVAASPEDREERFANAEATLLEVNAAMGRAALPKDNRKGAEIAIEILMRLEAMKNGKGWWFRAKRRIQLTQMYLGS